MDENKIVAVYAKQHSKIGNDFINQKISYDEYERRTFICALYADKKVRAISVFAGGRWISSR